MPAQGTNYRGLQIQPKTTGSADSIEYTLEEAIYQSGGILESNRGCLKKIGWARSSRTDKRVHSLCTVISLKLECDSGIFEEEPDGRSIAESINGHLPPEIRVFAVQRVVKSFDARRDCARRQYDYYLPLSFLMRANENRLSNQEIIERLREAWGMYEGYNAFHNFTKRRLYRYRTKMNEKGDNDKIMSASSSELESETESRIDLKSDFSVEEKSEEEDTHGNGTKGKIHIVWKDQKDDADPVTKRHFRLVEDCICSESPLLLTEDGIECLKLSITGQSFMLHQIRHMVGGAVLVALGKLPLDVLKAALTPPARINLPLAPPGTLLLRNAQFMKFRSSWDGRPSVTQKCSGEKLSLLSNGIEKQDRFAKDFLFPAINEQFSNDDWERWLDTIGFAYYDADAGSMIAERSQEWAAQRESRKLKREQAILEESEI